MCRVGSVDEGDESPLARPAACGVGCPHRESPSHRHPIGARGEAAGSRDGQQVGWPTAPRRFKSEGVANHQAERAAAVGTLRPRQVAPRKLECGEPSAMKGKSSTKEGSP